MINCIFHDGRAHEALTAVLLLVASHAQATLYQFVVDDVFYDPLNEPSPALAAQVRQIVIDWAGGARVDIHGGTGVFRAHWVFDSSQAGQHVEITESSGFNGIQFFGCVGGGLSCPIYTPSTGLSASFGFEVVDVVLTRNANTLEGSFHFLNQFDQITISGDKNGWSGVVGSDNPVVLTLLHGITGEWVRVAQAPEPSTALLLIAALLGLVAFRFVYAKSCKRWKTAEAQ